MVILCLFLSFVNYLLAYLSFGCFALWVVFDYMNIVYFGGYIGPFDGCLSNEFYFLFFIEFIGFQMKSACLFLKLDFFTGFLKGMGFDLFNLFILVIFVIRKQQQFNCPYVCVLLGGLL